MLYRTSTVIQNSTYTEHRFRAPLPQNHRGGGALSDSTVVKVTFKNIKTKKTTTKSYRCVVKAAAVEEPVEEELVISGVTQTASNAINVTFNKDASKDVTKDNLTIKSADGAVQLVVKSVEFSANGTSAKVTVYGNFVDGTTYNVAYDTLEKSFAASVGAVASVVINTTSAQQNVATPIEFTLFDANGIDVTPSISVDSYTYVTISGNYSTAEINNPSTAKITLDTVGAVATVTVTYNANTKDSADISATQDITCVDAKAVTGTTLFTVSNNINNKSDCAKFYQGLSDSSAKITVDASKNIYFCATDENGDAISYDSYEVESSNDNIVSVNVTTDTGKYAVISATGNNVGGAQLTVTATKNGKASYYTIPVTTYEAGVATKMTVEVDRTTMSNADDEDYYATITAQLYDAADEKVDGSYNAEAKTTAANSTSISSLGTNKFKVLAAGADAKTYVFEITGSDNVDNSKAFTKRVNVVVKALPNELKNVSYQLEVSKSTLDIADTANRDTVVKLYATCNGLFAGYVRNGSFDKIGGKDVAAKEQIAVVTGSAIFGTLTFGNGSLVTTAPAVSAPTLSGKDIIGLNLSTVNVSASNTVNARTDGKGDIARLGGYTIRFDLEVNGKTVSKTAGITVKNSYVQPTVKVLATKVDTLNDTAIINDGNLSTNVDMNNNTSSHESITGFTDAKYNAITGATNNAGNKMTVKYATVVDNIGNEEWTFYIPINTTFVQK